MAITEIVITDSNGNEKERFISEKAHNKAMREYRKNYMAFDVPKHLTLDYCKHICMEFTNWTWQIGYEYPLWYYGQGTRKGEENKRGPRYNFVHKDDVDFVVFLGPEKYSDVLKGRAKGVQAVYKPLAQIVFMKYYPREKQKNLSKYTYDELLQYARVSKSIEFKTVEEMIAHMEGFLASLSTMNECFVSLPIIFQKLEDKYNTDTKNITRIY